MIWGQLKYTLVFKAKLNKKVIMLKILPNNIYFSTMIPQIIVEPQNKENQKDSQLDILLPIF